MYIYIYMYIYIIPLHISAIKLGALASPINQNLIAFWRSKTKDFLSPPENFLSIIRTPGGLPKPFFWTGFLCARICKWRFLILERKHVQICEMTGSPFCRGFRVCQDNMYRLYWFHRFLILERKMMKHTGCSTPASVTVRAAMNMMASQRTKHFTHSIKRIKANHEK